jgi:LysM repeat protein
VQSTSSTQEVSNDNNNAPKTQENQAPASQKQEVQNNTTQTNPLKQQQEAQVKQQQEQQSSQNTYEVKSGENLSTIAQQNGLTLNQLLSLPGNEKFQASPDQLNPGDKVSLGSNDQRETLCSNNEMQVNLDKTHKQIEEFHEQSQEQSENLTKQMSDSSLNMTNELVQSSASFTPSVNESSGLAGVSKPDISISSLVAPNLPNTDSFHSITSNSSEGSLSSTVQPIGLVDATQMMSEHH